MNETDLKKQIRDLLRVKGIFHYNAWQGPMSEPGISDLIGIHKKACPHCRKPVDGIMTAIEVKGPKARQTPEQMAFIFNVQAKGGIGFFAWCVEDVIRELKLEGIHI